jgi:hypothetical protein
MTNQEALQAELSVRVKSDTIELNLIKQKLEPDAEYDPEDTDNVRGVDLALAGIILFISIAPKSIKELDFAITQQEVKDLLLVRAGILERYGVDDEMSQNAEITNISDRW